MTRSALAILGAIAVLATAGQANAQKLCVRESMAPGEADSVFQRRALEIAQASLAGDVGKLRAMIAPQAEFVIWRGDAAEGGRGVLGALAMARSLKAKSYQALAPISGPISIVPPVCSAVVTVMFRTTDTTAVSVDFKFEGGLLVSATGHEMTLTEGSLPAAAPPLD